MRTLAALLRLGRPPWARVALSVALGALAVLTGAGLLSFAGYLISRSAERPPILALSFAVAAVRAFGVARPVARYFDRLASHDLAFRVLARLRVQFYRRLEPLVPGNVPGSGRGDLLARMVGDVDAMQNLFLRGISPPLVALTAGVMLVAACAAFVPAAGLVLAAGLLAGGLGVPALAAALGRRHGSREAALKGELTAAVVECVRGAPELVVLGADGAALERVAALDAELTRLLRGEALAAGLVEGLGVLVAGLTTTAVLAVCVAATAGGSLDRVFVAALTLLAMASFEAVAPLPATALRLRATMASGRRLLEIAQRRPAVADPDAPEPAPAVPPEAPGGAPVLPSAALDGVSFAFAGGETWDLEDVDLRLVAGRRVALVGPSGAGKSTVAALLVRFIDPDIGRVTLAGVDERRLRRRDVRAAVTLDGQDAYLFSTNVRENVRLAKPGASDDEVVEALRRAQVLDWVRSLPEGLDTFVGEEGDQVSGGERRRLVLARAFLAGAPVLVLDEPTAHLDAETATLLMADVLAASRDRTVLLITHRPEGLDQVDEIVRLRRGRLADGPAGD